MLSHYLKKIKSFKKTKQKTTSVFLTFSLFLQIIAGVLMPMNLQTTLPYISQIEKVQASGESWYNTSWLYRVKITVLSAKVDADITSFPVYVNLNNLPAGFHTHVNQTDARDIRVTTSDGITEAPREVVSYDSATDTGELHFKGNILDLTDVDFYIYYGNGSASDYAPTDTYGRNNVWEAAAKMVQHMKDTTTSTITDSTINANNGTKKAANEPIEATGKIVKEQSFDGVDDYVNIESGASLDIIGDLTIAAWVNVPDVGATRYTILSKAGNSISTNQYSLRINAGSARLVMSNGSADFIAAQTITTNQYHFVVATVLNNVMNVYVNSVSGAPVTITGTRSTSTENVVIGVIRPSTPTNYFSGSIDEVKIYNRALSATEISTQHNNQFNTSTFYSLSAEEAGNTTPNIPALVSPSDASYTNDTNPTLSANYSDSDTGDTGTTNYRIASTNASDCLNNLNIADSGTSSVTTTNDEATTHTPSSSIGINGTYYWCAQNNDGALTSAWTSMGSFILDTVSPASSIAYSDADSVVKAGDFLTITATFSEALLDSPIVKLAISGSNTLSASDMTKTDATHYTYTHTVGAGDGTATVALTVGADQAGNIITSAPTSGATFIVDNTAPNNQDTVFASSTSKQSAEAVAIISSEDATNDVWFAPSGTTAFAEGATITKATNGIATSILSPTTAGTYKLFVIDTAGNYSAESTASLTVDNGAPIIASISSDKANGSYKAGEIINIDITFSEAVTSTGNVTITLETGGTDQTCVFTITNSTTGSCDYTVQAGDNSSDLDATISGIINDQASNLLTNYTPTTTLSTNKDLLIDTTAPTNTALFLGSISANSITVTVSGTTDGTGSGIHATPYYFENTTAGTNSGWISNTSWASSSLSCGTEYSFHVKTRDALTNESAFTSLSISSTSNCGGGGLPSDAYNPPTPPAPSPNNLEGKFSVIINNNDEYATSGTVNLKLSAGSNTKKMAISNYSDFRNASQIPYETIFNYQFPIFNQLSISNDQTLTIYAKFYTAYGVASETVSDNIILKNILNKNQTENSTDQNMQDDSANTNNNPEINNSDNPNNNNFEISELRFIFTRHLAFGSQGAEVVHLQDKLKELSFFPKEIISNGNFGPATKKAITEFQKSKNIYPSNGIVGPRTKKALNNQEFITNKDYRFTRDLKYNDKNEEVKQIQTRLKDQNFFPYDVSSTGWFGPITQTAVNIFQKFYNIIQSGIVDEGMREVLNK